MEKHWRLTEGVIKLTNNIEKYNGIFKRFFGDNTDYKIAAFNETVGWDSVGHMSLITEIEEIFDVFFETEDLLNFNSYETGKTILRKYGVTL